MVTKEALLARRAQLENDLAVQQQIIHAAEAARQDAIAKITHARDLINALSGAKQDVDHWIAQFPVPEPGADAPAKTVEEDQLAKPPQEPIN